MTREQLAKLDASKVRKDKTLFALFKEFVTEDAALIYSSGKLPQGCFGCQFSALFQKWRGHIITDKSIKKMSKSTGKTYELGSPTYRVYFKGGVLSKESSDAEWVDWILWPDTEEKRAARRAQFETLPEELQEEKKQSAKKATPKKSVKKTVANPEEPVIEAEKKAEELQEENPETNE